MPEPMVATKQMIEQIFDGAATSGRGTQVRREGHGHHPTQPIKMGKPSFPLTWEFTVHPADCAPQRLPDASRACRSWSS